MGDMAQINWYQFTFARIGPEDEIEIIERSLAPLSEAIGKCAMTIEDAQTSDNEDYIDSVIDDETALIENLLGTAFVLCRELYYFRCIACKGAT